MSNLLQKLTCPVCSKQVPELTYDLEEKFRQQVVDAVKQKNPEWTQKSGICMPCLNYYRYLITKPSKFKQLKDRLQGIIAKQHHPEKQ